MNTLRNTDPGQEPIQAALPQLLRETFADSVSFFSFEQEIQSSIPYQCSDLKQPSEFEFELNDNQESVKIVSTKEILEEKEETREMGNKVGKRKGIKKKRFTRKKIKFRKNETKNIPKNYGKQMINFILRNQQILQPVMAKMQFSLQSVIQQLNNKKKKMIKISQMKSIWSSQEHARPISMICEWFLRKHALSWIFNSRIKDISAHLKYRKHILEGVRNPERLINFRK